MAKAKSATMKIYNNSKQMIPLQVRAPGGDFYTSEHQIRIGPGQTVDLIKSHLNLDQIENLQRRRMIKVIFDSEATETV